MGYPCPPCTTTQYTSIPYSSILHIRNNTTPITKLLNKFVKYIKMYIDT